MPRNPKRRKHTPASLKARNDLIARHWSRVKSLASTMHRRLPSFVEFDDLYSAAALGLVNAADTFDPTRGKSFSEYSRVRMWGAMIDDHRTRDILGRYRRTRAREIADASARLTVALGRNPEPGELSAELGITVDQLHAEQAALSTKAPASVDREGNDLLDDIPDDHAIDALESLIDREDRAEMARDATRLLGAFTERDAAAFRMRHGEEMSTEEIGRALGVSPSRISQIATKIMRGLRGKAT